jgi:hapalindole biogenesis HpiC1 cyclase-like protein/PEP-CTERM motif-containing protein
MRLKLLLICMLTVCTALTCSAVRADGVIPVVNGSFDSHDAFTTSCVSGCLFNFGPIPGWTASGQAGSFEPDPTQFNLPLPGAGIVAYSNGGTLTQDVGVAVQDNTTYVLTVDIGHRLNYFLTSYSIALDDGSTPLCSTPLTSDGSITPGTFAVVTLTCTTGSSVAPGDLTIVLTSSGNQIDFDNVSLVDPVATPEPSAVILMLVGLGFVALLWKYSSRKNASQVGAC